MESSLALGSVGFWWWGHIVSTLQVDRWVLIWSMRRWLTVIRAISDSTNLSSVARHSRTSRSVERLMSIVMAFLAICYTAH